MKKLMVVPVVVVMLFAGFGFSDAAMRGRGAGQGMGMAAGHPMFEKFKSLGLDEKQMAEIKSIHFATMKEVTKKRADMQVARIELREMLSKDPVDLKAVEAKIRQIEAARGDIMMMHIKALEEVKSKLTPEQRKKFESMMPMMQGGMMMGKMAGKGRMKGGSQGCCMCGMMGGGMMGPGDECMMYGDCAAQDTPMEHGHMHHGK